MKVEETSMQNGDYPLEPHIGSLLVKSAPTDEETYEVSFSIKNKRLGSNQIVI
jgi:hypothetical protein